MTNLTLTGKLLLIAFLVGIWFIGLAASWGLIIQGSGAYFGPALCALTGFIVALGAALVACLREPL